MVVAFSAVVVVQWLWIKYTIQEKETQFSARVYDVLNRVVSRVEEINYMKYLRDMQQQLGEFQDYNDLVSSSVGNMPGGLNSAYLSDFLTNDINRVNSERSYLSQASEPYPRSGGSKMVNQEFMLQTIRSLRFGKTDTLGKINVYAQINEVLKDFMSRLVNEKDPQNVSVRTRLENIDINGLFLAYLRRYDIRIPFTYEILAREDVLHKVKDKQVKNFYYVDLFPFDYVKKDFYLGISFETVQPVIMENMGWMFLSSGFCIFGLLFVFIVTIYIIMRQQKMSLVKNDFINNMTHEFKTPIATISLATSAITKDKVLNDREQILKFNAVIKSENDRMNKYVERILQQAKLDRRDIHLNLTEVDMNELLREAAEHFMLQVQNAGGTLVCHLDAEHFILCVDEVHMLNVICNLIDNAIKYSAEKPEIEVYTRKEGGTFLIGVRDHGIGISKDAQKKVFKRFYRVNTGNLHNVKGFGLGLSYVKSIVLLHNGTIRLTSRKNKGTLIEIIFKID